MFKQKHDGIFKNIQKYEIELKILLKKVLMLKLSQNDKYISTKTNSYPDENRTDFHNEG